MLHSKLQPGFHKINCILFIMKVQEVLNMQLYVFCYNKYNSLTVSHKHIGFETMWGINIQSVQGLSTWLLENPCTTLQRDKKYEYILTLNYS